MQNINLILFLAATLTIASCEWSVNGCVSGDGNEETRTIELDNDVDEIVLQLEAELFVSQGTSQEITIEGDGNLIDLIESDSDVDGDEWEIKIDGCSDTDGLKIFAKLKDLEKITIQGSGEVKMEEDLFEELEDLKLQIEGSGKMNIELGSADKIESKIEGSGKIKIEGATDELDIGINGSGKFQCHDLIAQDAVVKIAGSGEIEVHAEQTLEIKIEGSGKVCYKGSPQIDTDISGSGNIENCN